MPRGGRRARCLPVRRAGFKATRGGAPGQQDSKALGAGFSKASHLVALRILLPPGYSHHHWGSAIHLCLADRLETGQDTGRTRPGCWQHSIPTGPLGVCLLCPVACFTDSMAKGQELRSHG